MEKDTAAAYALALIDTLLGPHTAAAYRRVYQGRTNTEIRTSLMKVLGEYLGSTEAQHELDRFDQSIKHKRT